MDFKFGRYSHRVHPNKRLPVLKILEKREPGRIHGLPNVLKYPLLCQERVKLRTSNLAGTFKLRPIKRFEEKGAWECPGTAQLFKVPHIISGTGKAADFKFGRAFTQSIRTKAH